MIPAGLTPVYSASPGGRETVRADFATRWSELLKRRGQLLVRGVAQTLANEISSGGKYSPGTPIDKGFHRASWDAAIGSVPAGGSAGTPGAALARMEEQALALEVGQTLYLTNDGPAIRRLEFDGWSQQAPDGFVRPAARAIQQIVDEVGEHLEAQDR